MRSTTRRYVAVISSGLLLVALLFVLDSPWSPAPPPVTHRKEAPQHPPAEAERQGGESPVHRTAAAVDATAPPAVVQVAEAGWRIAVRDRRSQPVVGAVVRAASLDGALIASGATDRDGRLGMAVPGAARTVVLTVFAEGFADSRSTLSDPPLGELVIVLDDASIIVGTVQRFDGRPAPAGVRVVAWASASMPPALLAAHLDHGAGVLQGVTAADGTFRLERAAAQRDYMLVAGGQGWCTRDPYRRRAGASEPVQLVVAGLYGCVARALLPDGSKPHQSQVGTVHHHEGSAPELTSVDYPSTELVVAGMPVIPGATAGGLHDWRAVCQAYLADVDAETLHGFAIEYNVPGHAPERFPLALNRLRVAWHEVTLVVRPNAAGFGELAVRFGTSDPADIAACPERDLRLTMEMVPRSAPDMAFEVPVVRRGESAVVAGIPYGVYDVRLRSRYGWRFPAAGSYQVAIGAERTAMRVPGAEFGVILVDIKDHEADARPAHAFALVKTPRGVARTLLSRAPYVLYGVPAGDHEIVIETAYQGSTWRSDLGKISVSASRLVRVRADLQLVR